MLMLFGSPPKWGLLLFSENKRTIAPFLLQK